jgi:peptidoglycan/LPS O-acetylase OafA/YrhL
MSNRSSCSPVSATRPSAVTTISRKHVRGLDSIRFWCALWVYFSHFGFIPVPENIGIPRIVTGIYNNLFCGAAAVIVFFVISGFCIHYPTLGDEKIDLPVFYVRRYIRILCPVAAALVLGSYVGQDVAGFYNTILWSLVAELIYYTSYPAIRPFLIRAPDTAILVASIAALAVIAIWPAALNFHEFGFHLTWVVGLPSWILGCRLATLTATDRGNRTSPPWLWRGAVWISSILASILRFHADIGYPFTLTLLGWLVFLWIREEIRFYDSALPHRWIEAGGRWSYSMYLIHGLAALEFARIGIKLSAIPLWVFQSVAALLLSYCFYVLVEKPSHVLARSMARRVRQRYPEQAIALR